MGFMARTVKFTLGGMAGAAAGAVVAILVAPDSGPDFQRKLRERFATAKVAGLQAKADKEAELVRRFRMEVGDPSALQDVEAQSTGERAQAIAAAT
jgi:gas vesicle protein